MNGRGECIVLIGFMGAGKTSIGRELAKRAGLPLRDLDELVATPSGRTIPEIFAHDGEQEFRRRETAALQALDDSRAVIATGGGIVVRAENVEAARRLGCVIYLAADEETLWRRIEGFPRPLLDTADPRATFAELLRARNPLYRDAADLTVDTTKLALRAATDAVLEAHRNWHGHQS